jgi:hypothetical protein
MVPRTQNSQENPLARPSLMERSVIPASHQIKRMTAEGMREVGVLLVVFAPLDSFFARDRLTVLGVAAILALAALFFAAGLYLGVERS